MRAFGNPISDELKGEILKLDAAGLSPVQIAELTGVAQPTVRKTLWSAGRSLQRPCTVREQREILRLLIREGKPPAAVSKILGLPLELVESVGASGPTGLAERDRAPVGSRKRGMRG